MALVRTLRITFSHTSAFSETFSTSTLSSIRPAVFSFSLWQVTQYLFSSARWDEAGEGLGLTACGLAASRQFILAAANPMNATIGLNIAIFPFSILLPWR